MKKASHVAVQPVRRAVNVVVIVAAAAATVVGVGAAGKLWLYVSLIRMQEVTHTLALPGCLTVVGGAVGVSSFWYPGDSCAGIQEARIQGTKSSEWAPGFGDMYHTSLVSHGLSRKS